VVLPGVGEAAPAQATPLGAAIDKPKGHVLIVDDETAILKLLCGCLEAVGWRVSGFASPRQALAVFRDAPDEFAAIISDQTMPGMTGGDLIRSIHALRPHLPAILCTGYSDGLDAATARQQGIRRLLLKPVDTDELLAALEQAVTEEEIP